VDDWAKDPENNTKLIAQTFREAADVAESFGERLAAEGEICWGGMHSWREMVKLLELTGRPKTVGFQADMAHTLLYTLGYNAEPEDRIVPENFNWEPEILDEALRQLTASLRPWTIDFHVAQNDGTVHGSGTHDKTGRHCLVNAAEGKLDIRHHAGFWLRDAQGQLTQTTRHICWDGCMFPNDVMMKQQTWNDILGAMVAVREAHGWTEAAAKPSAPAPAPKAATQIATKPSKRAAKKPAKSAPKAKAKTKAKKRITKKAGPKKTAKKSVKKSQKVKSRKIVKTKAKKAKKPAKKVKKVAAKKSARKGKKK